MTWQTLQLITFLIVHASLYVAICHLMNMLYNKIIITFHPFFVSVSRHVDTIETN